MKGFEARKKLRTANALTKSVAHAVHYSRQSAARASFPLRRAPDDARAARRFDRQEMRCLAGRQ